MKILHICNDFSKTKVHCSLYKELDLLGVEQTVYNPVRDINLVGRNVFQAQSTDFIFANIVKSYYKYFYHFKRHQVYKNLNSQIEPKGYDLCHATTLLTDGGLAYLLYKKYRIPYVVAIRNTDVNGFLDHLPHTWIAARKILCCAERVFFISEGLKKKFVEHIAVRDLIPKMEDRFVSIPNGINDYYLSHIKNTPHTGQDVVYVGNFSNNKNVLRLAKAVLLLKDNPQFCNITLTLVGGGKNESEEIDKMISAHPDTIHYLGPIYDQSQLCEIFASKKVFAMPSIHETFGLVYIEALSQNLPVIYTKGQGIDGMFDESIGIAVYPHSIESIMDALKKILLDEGQYSNSSVDFTQFKWQSIAEKYMELYNSVLEKHR